jgi:hypothetical protein
MTTDLPIRGTAGPTLGSLDFLNGNEVDAIVVSAFGMSRPAEQSRDGGKRVGARCPRRGLVAIRRRIR